MPRPTPRFHIRKTKSGQYRPYLRAANGEHVAGTETYTRRQDASRWIGNLIRWVSQASEQTVVEDDTK